MSSPIVAVLASWSAAIPAGIGASVAIVLLFVTEQRGRKRLRIVSYNLFASFTTLAIGLAVVFGGLYVKFSLGPFTVGPNARAALWISTVYAQTLVLGGWMRLRRPELYTLPYGQAGAASVAGRLRQVFLPFQDIGAEVTAAVAVDSRVLRSSWQRQKSSLLVRRLDQRAASSLVSAYSRVSAKRDSTMSAPDRRALIRALSKAQTSPGISEQDRVQAVLTVIINSPHGIEFLSSPDFDRLLVD